MVVADFSNSGGVEAVAQALAGGSPQRMGTFRFYFDDERWEWCEQVARLHGYEPGSVTPTTELMLAHKPPDDRNQIAATLDDIRRTHRAFSTRHRIIDVQGNIHEVVVVANQLVDAEGSVIGTEGFHIDVTRLDQEHQEAVTVEVAKSPRSAPPLRQPLPWCFRAGKQPDQNPRADRCAMMTKLSRVREQRWISTLRWSHDRSNV